MSKGSIICLLLFTVLAWTCKPDFIEVDLSKTTVVLRAPSDNLQTSTFTHTFWWYEVEGATGYEIQVVSPSFANLATLLLDSNTISDQYTLTLTPGSYEWQVRAYNGSSTTPFTTFTLGIDSSPDLASQFMVLTSPVNNWVTNQMTVTFKWDTLSNADDYRFEIYTPDFNGTVELAPQTETGDSTSHTFSQEGIFQWRVRGQNDFSNTPYTTYLLEIDTTAPNVPSLSLPLNNQNLTDSINTWNWDRGVVTGSSIMDSLFFYSDTNMVNLILDVYTANTSYADSIGGPGDYYWRVLSIDAASNRSAYSVLRKFTIQ